MKKFIKVNNILFFVIMFSSIILAQSGGRSEHRNDFFPNIRNGLYDREIVEFIGVVTSWEKVPQTTTVEYWVKDDWGEVISVICQPPYPETEKRYKIRGVVSVTNTQPIKRYIVQDSRIPWPPAFQQEPEPDNKKVKAKELLEEADKRVNQIPWYRMSSEAEKYLIESRKAYQDDKYEESINLSKKAIDSANNASLNLILFLIIISLIIITLIIVLFVLRSSEERKSDKIEQSVVPEPKPTEVGETIKFHVPPPGTLKVLPGRFKVIKGDSKVSEIRFFKTKNNPDSEYIFSRNMGSQKYKTIQINDPTVSSEQAKLYVEGDKYLLINRADPQRSNATIVNGRTLELNESVELQNGDEVIMGTVELVFEKSK